MATKPVNIPVTVPVAPQSQTLNTPAVTPKGPSGSIPTKPTNPRPLRRK